MLCVVEPERFLPVLKYSAPTDGKKEIAKLVFDLDLPPAEKVAWTIGRLVVWSNDLLRSLVGNDIPDLQQATQFLRGPDPAGHVPGLTAGRRRRSPDGDGAAPVRDELDPGGARASRPGCRRRRSAPAGRRRRS